MRRLFSSLAVLVGATCAFSSLVVATATDDQATADAAVAEFTERVTAAGWVSEGPTELDDESANDELFAACERGSEAVQAVFTGEFEGETAQAYSDSFAFIPEGSEQPATTDPLDFSSENQELVAAFVVSVDDDHRDELAMLVDMIGSAELVDCVEQSIVEDMAPDSSTEPSDGVTEESFEYTVENEANLGVGDASASLRIAFDSEIMGESFRFDIALYLAQVDRTLVGVLTGLSGPIEPVSGLDPLAELSALAEDVSA